MPKKVKEKKRKAIHLIQRDPIIENRNGDIQINMSVLREIKDVVNQLVIKADGYVQCGCWKCTDK